MRKATLAGTGVNILVSLAQILGGIFTHSQALLADGIHTLSDLISDGVVLLASKHSNQAADEAHPYGHQRIETLGSVVIALILFAVGLGIAYEALHRLMTGAVSHPKPIALIFASIAILGKESLFHYTIHIARRINSNLLKANAWHHRSDVMSSFIVFVGITGSLLGARGLDNIAALLVALFIGRIAWELASNGIRELIDTGLPAEEVQKIREIILATDGVRGLHMLRTRRMGNEALIDVHIIVNSKISVSEGHHISEAVEKNLKKKIGEINDITVHIDPEDDEMEALNIHLPLRKALITALQDQWKGLESTKNIDYISLHYLEGKVHLEIHLHWPSPIDAETAKKVTDDLVDRSGEIPDVGNVYVYFRFGPHPNGTS